MADGVALLLRYIEQSGLKNGDRLPPERDLSVILGLTRTALRRSLAMLEADGRIWRHVGRGTFIGGRPMADLPSDIPADANPQEVMELRMMLEPRAAGLAALRATTRDMADIERALEASVTAVEMETFEHWDAAFHRAVITACGNRMLMRLYELVHAARSDRLWGRLKRASLTPARRLLYIDQHRRIAAAIVDRDAATAEREMAAHLREVRDNLFQSQPLSDIARPVTA